MSQSKVLSFKTSRVDLIADGNFAKKEKVRCTSTPIQHSVIDDITDSRSLMECGVNEILLSE